MHGQYLLEYNVVCHMTKSDVEMMVSTAAAGEIVRLLTAYLWLTDFDC